MFQRILTNAIQDVCTTVAGGLAGSQDLLEGLAEKNAAKIVKGGGLILMGLLINSKK
jgi:hypothetical protein